MKQLFLLRSASIIFILAISGCWLFEETDVESKKDIGELEIPIVRKSPKRVISLQNEPDNFRKIKFGTHIDEINKKHKMIFVKSKYGRLFGFYDATLNIAHNGRNMSGNFTSDPEKWRCITCLSEKGKRASIYKKASDKMQIGSVPLDYIWYHFYEGKLCTVEIGFNGDHWYKMERIFFEIYGFKNDTDDKKKNWHIWEGENVYIKLWLANKNQINKKGFIEYCYLPIQKEDAEKSEEERRQWWEKHHRKENERERILKKEYYKAIKRDL